MVCCVVQATNLVNNYRPRKSERTFVSGREASNKLYTVLYAGFYFLKGCEHIYVTRFCSLFGYASFLSSTVAYSQILFL